MKFNAPTQPTKLPSPQITTPGTFTGDSFPAAWTAVPTAPEFDGREYLWKLTGPGVDEFDLHGGTELDVFIGENFGEFCLTVEALNTRNEIASAPVTKCSVRSDTPAVPEEPPQGEDVTP